MKARLVATQRDLETPAIAPMVIVQGNGAPILEQALHFFVLPNRSIESLTPKDVSQILGKDAVLSEVRVLESDDIYSREYRQEVGAWYDEFLRQIAEEQPFALQPE
jgi:hypothetical protein